jgi:hypothetical protein
MIDRLLFDHPRSVGESYGEHLLVAGGFGMAMIGAGLACMVHAIVPGLFARTGSATIETLHGRMVRNRRRPAPRRRDGDADRD